MKKLLKLITFLGLFLTLVSLGLLTYHLFDTGNLNNVANWLGTELGDLTIFIPLAIMFAFVLLAIIVLTKKQCRCGAPMIVTSVLLGLTGFIYLLKNSALGFYVDTYYNLGQLFTPARLVETSVIIALGLATILMLVAITLGFMFKKPAPQVLGKNPIKIEEEEMEQAKPAFVVDQKPQSKLDEEAKKQEVKQEKEEQVKPVTKTSKTQEVEPKVGPKVKPVKEKEPSPTKKETNAPKKTSEEKAPLKKQPPKKSVKKAPAKEENVSKAEDDNDEASKGRRVYHLNKRAEDNKWTIIFAGGKRVIKLCDTQKEAIEYVKTLCENNGGTYLVHNSKGKNKGRIQSK